MRKTGWVPFGLWAIPGVVVGLQVSVIGVFLLPVGLIAAVLLTRYARRWPEVLGLFEGVAAVCFFVVVLSADYWTCPPSGEVTTRTKNTVTIDSCGDVNPWPWLIVGLICAVGALSAFVLARRDRADGLGVAPGP